ncbi:MAG: TldD/PmbA family protein [Chloroflexi bacterium]|nr:TldD/PmbA family protein [Chloroflexota bacterium]
MHGEAALQTLALRALEASRADETEVVVLSGESSLTRFANSAIHQNVHEVDLEVRVRAVSGSRVGVAVSNRSDDPSLRQVVAQALTSARLAPEDPEFRGVPHPEPVPKVTAHSTETAAYTAQQRAWDVKAACDLAASNGLEASGFWSTREREVLVANSKGVLAYRVGTQGSFKTVMLGENSSGYAERNAFDVKAIDVPGAAQEAVAKALRSRNPEALAPGEYPVVLEPYAVGTMVGYLAYMGLSATAVQEGRSFMSEFFGERVAAPSVSLWDDGLDPNGIPASFDFEGVPKQRVDCIDHGVATAVVYDSYTAGKEGRKSTGHALPAPNPGGPYPGHLFVEAGDADEAGLASGIKRGIWVTRFHYVNPVHPKRTIITGMTRDGTFLVEDGAVTRPIKNLRFTQSVLEALSSVEAVGNSRLLVQDEAGGACVPAVRIGHFRFSSATQF